MSSSTKLNRKFTCPSCGTEVKIPLAWALGVEMVFRCPTCRTNFRTGYKMGAMLSGLALTIALALANLLVYIFSSHSIPLLALLIIPCWLWISYIFRRLWLVHRISKQ